MLNAYVDESLRLNGTCIVAVVVVDDSAEHSLREELVGLLPGGASRLHWRDDSSRVRRSVIELVARSAHHGCAYLSYFDHPRRGDEARARCLAHAFSDMGGSPYARLVCDGRSPHQDLRDQLLFVEQCVRLHLPFPPTLMHKSSLEEPLLWLPDALAGAVGEHIVHGSAEFVKDLASKLRLV